MSKVYVSNPAQLETAPTGPGAMAVICSKIDTYGSVRNAGRIWVSTPQNRTYRRMEVSLYFSDSL